jgi:phosphoglycerate dehydrogenase-like enzyme
MKNELPQLASTFDIVYEENLGSLAKEARERVVAAITGGPSGKPLGPEHLGVLPNIAVVGVVGASVKRWGGELAIERHIPVINTADAYADAVAEFIVMQALVGLRRASMSHAAMQGGGWNFSVPNFSHDLKQRVRRLAQVPLLRTLKQYAGFLRPAVASGNGGARGPSTRMLRGRTVGIIGFGEITKKTVPLFKSFGAHVLVHSDHAAPDELQALGAQQASLAEVLRADVVSLQRGLSARTARSFGARELNALRPGTVLVNAARAGLIDTEALIARLKKGDIFACLDVFDQEPPSRTDELRTLPNVFLTSHIAGSVHHVQGLLGIANAALIGKITRFLNGKPVAVIETREQLANMT